MSGMRGVFGHRPEGHGDVVPEVRRAGQSEVSVGGLVPVFGAAVFAVGGDHAAELFDEQPTTVKQSRIPLSTRN